VQGCDLFMRMESIELSRSRGQALSSAATAPRERAECSPRLEERLERAADTARIRQRIRKHLQQHAQLSAQASDLMVLCVEEACSNALRHSGSGEPTHVSVELRGDEVVAVIKDHGLGFDVDGFQVEEQPDPFGSGGRGLWLIAHLMDDLELELDDGLTVRMTMRCDRSTKGAGSRP